MIKKEYLGSTITISNGSSKRKIEVYEGMHKNDIKALLELGIEIEEKPKKRKSKKYEGIEEPKQEDNGEA